MFVHIIVIVAVRPIHPFALAVVKVSTLNTTGEYWIKTLNNCTICA